MHACPCIARWSLTTGPPGKSFLRLFLFVQVIREIYDRIYWIYHSILLLEGTGMMYFLFIYLFLAVLGLFWTVVLEKTLESPLDGKETKPVNSKGNQSWIFIGRTDTEAETLILWPPNVKNWLIGKDSDVGKDWRQEKKGTTEDEMRIGITDSKTWVWASSGSWWWTGKPGVLQSVGLQSVGHNWATELNWTELCWIFVTVCRLSLVAVSVGYSLAAVRGLLTAVVSLVAEHRL